MNEDIIKEIKSTLPWLLVALLAVGGFYGFKHYRAVAKANESQAVVSAMEGLGRQSDAPMGLEAGGDTAALEDLVAKFGTGKTGPAIKLCLAKAYFDAGRYDDAIAIYDEVAAAKPDGLYEIPAVGKAMCLECQGKYAEAKAAFEQFASANAKSPFALTARLGSLRMQALLGDRDGALKALAAMKKDEFKEGTPDYGRVLELEDCVKRLAAK